jgi:hypothetical protein
LTIVNADGTDDTAGDFTPFKVTYTGMVNIGINMKFLKPDGKIVIGWNPDFLLASAW